MLPAQRHHQLLVRLLLAVLVQHAHVRLAPVERLAGFAEPAREAVVDEGQLEDALEGFEHGHLAAAAAATRAACLGDLDFFIFFFRRRGGSGGGGLFSVRLLWKKEVVC